MRSEQTKILGRHWVPITSSGDQTVEQAKNVQVDNLRYIFYLEGVPAPTEAEIRAWIAAHATEGDA